MFLGRDGRHAYGSVHLKETAFGKERTGELKDKGATFKVGPYAEKTLLLIGEAHFLPVTLST